MGENSKIEWTEFTWNFVTGCTRISAGCEQCYIPTTMPFRTTGRRFNKPGIGGTTDIQLHPERLNWPLTRWKNKPGRVFVNSLSDVFHEQIPVEFIAEAFAVMALAPQRQFQLLTKRHARMRSVLSSPDFPVRVEWEMKTRGCKPVGDWWPLKNVWVGVSTENQQWADIRIPALLATPAAVRWISAEPLLGPINLRREWVTDGDDRPHLDWAVFGGESGKGARPCDPAWISDAVAQCVDGSTVPFVKQLGTAWARDAFVGGQAVYRSDPKGGDWQYWPTDLRRRQYPTTVVAQ